MAATTATIEEENVDDDEEVEEEATSETTLEDTREELNGDATGANEEVVSLNRDGLGVLV